MVRLRELLGCGFRSSFRDWAGNETSYPRDLIETALAHVIGDKAEQAYRRSDAFRKAPQTYGGMGKLLRAESPFERIASAKALKFSLGLAPYRTKGNLLSIRNLLDS